MQAFASAIARGWMRWSAPPWFRAPPPSQGRVGVCWLAFVVSRQLSLAKLAAGHTACYSRTVVTSHARDEHGGPAQHRQSPYCTEFLYRTTNSLDCRARTAHTTRGSVSAERRCVVRVVSLCGPAHDRAHGMRVDSRVPGYCILPSHTVTHPLIIP